MGDYRGPAFYQGYGKKAFVDLAAERLLTARKESELIAVEIKSFSGSSFLDDFHLAVGQFLNYRVVLAELDPERKLYLAVPLDTYEEYFLDGFAIRTMKAYSLSLVVYNPETEELMQWIN
jgi:hypothetical protein